MNEPSIKLVACPCCRAPLYTLHFDRLRSKWSVADGSPPLSCDADGLFMECPRCLRRVTMIEAPDHAEEPFFVAAKQGCKRCLTVGTTPLT